VRNETITNRNTNLNPSGSLRTIKGVFAGIEYVLEREGEINCCVSRIDEEVYETEEEARKENK